MIIHRIDGSARKFKIITEEKTLTLKAETSQEREEWIQALVHETHAALGMNMDLQSQYDDPNDHRALSDGVGAAAPTFGGAGKINNLQAIQDFQMPKQNVPSIRQITELLQKYQDSLASKIDSS